MSFFSLFPKISYDFNKTNRYTEVNDILRSVAIDKVNLDNVLLYKQYRIIDGDSPWQTSQRLYNTPDYHWTFALINPFLREGYGNWALSNYQISKYLDRYFSNLYVIQLRPLYTLGIEEQYTGTINSVIGRFDIGETIIGLTSGSQATIKDIDFQREQILLENITGNFFSGETIRGMETLDVVNVASFSSLHQAIYEYRDYSGEVQSPNVLFMDNGVDVSQLKTISYSDIIYEINDIRQSINAVNPSHITTFAEKVMEKIKQ